MKPLERHNKIFYNRSFIKYTINIKQIQLTTNDGYLIMSYMKWKTFGNLKLKIQTWRTYEKIT